MNSVQILGNLARDPEVRFTKTGRAVATFTVAATNTYIDSTTNIEAESQEEKYAFSVQTISIKSTIKMLQNFVVSRLNVAKSYLVVFPVLAQNINAN